MVSSAILASSWRTTSASTLVGSSFSPWASLSLATQLANVPGLIPRSRATWAMGFPVSRTIPRLLDGSPGRTGVSSLACHLLTRWLHEKGGFPDRAKTRLEAHSLGTLLTGGHTAALHYNIRDCVRTGGHPIRVLSRLTQPVDPTSPL